MTKIKSGQGSRGDRWPKTKWSRRIPNTSEMLSISNYKRTSSASSTTESMRAPLLTRLKSRCTERPLTRSNSSPKAISLFFVEISKRFWKKGRPWCSKLYRLSKREKKSSRNSPARSPNWKIRTDKLKLSCNQRMLRRRIYKVRLNGWGRTKVEVEMMTEVVAVSCDVSVCLYV